MSQLSLPRYFVSRSEGQISGASSDEVLPPDHIVDSFIIGARHLAECELAVAVDAAGNLQTLSLESDDLSEAVQTELAYHEMAGGRGRLIEASEFFLFHLELLEQPAGTPGWNDPVYLYGTLYVPYPAPASRRLVGVEGQLAITRGDLLEGLVHGADYAFRYANSDSEAGSPPRCFHLMLPADREEEIHQGMGVALAYPLLPAELRLADASNEIVVKQLLYDILISLKDDLERERIAHFLRSMTVPVPSRFALEQQLQSQGYVIKGNAAVKKGEGGAGFKGFLAGVFGSLMSESLELPPEAGIDEFLEISRRALNALPGWPSPRATALRNRVKPAPAESYRNSARRRPAKPPQIRIPHPGEAGRRPQIHPLSERDQPPDWMRDFIAAHHRPDAAPPRLTSASGLRTELNWRPNPVAGLQPQSRAPEFASERATERAPEWMEDFKDAPSRKQPNDSKRPAPAPEPDWMKDFE